MATTTQIDILNMLVAAGLDRTKAEPLAKEILTKSEAQEMLATKTDLEVGLVKMRASIIQWVAALLIAQAGLTAALVKLIS